jgi:hypothetical protein
MGQVMSSNARAGILNSGHNRRQLEAERSRLMNLKNQASAEGQKFVQGTMQNIFSNYNQGLGQQGQFLSGASNASAQAGQIANQIPQNQLQAAERLGADYRNTLGFQTSLETQGRNEQINRQIQNNEIANQQALTKYNRDASQATSNWSGKNEMQKNTPSIFSSALQGASNLAPWGSIIGGALGSFGGGGNNSSMTYNSGGYEF